MREFDLVSIDWDTVRLMQAGQFKQETYYLEELSRWILQRGRNCGLLHLDDDGISLPSPEGGQTYSVTVRGCMAVTPNGYWVDIPQAQQAGIIGSIDATSSYVPLFVGVSLTEKKREPNLHPTTDSGLLGCGGLRSRYIIASDDSDSRFDWLQIALFEKTPSGLRFARDYVPECLFVTSHAVLVSAYTDICALVKRSLDTLSGESSTATARFAVAAALIGSLAPAARVVDSRLSPGAYVDRLAGVLAAQRAQLLALPQPGLKLYQDTLDLLSETLTYIDGSDWAIGRTLVMARECFERLLSLYPPLLKALESTSAAPEPVSMGHRTATPAQPPAPTPQARPGTMWRGNK